MCHAYSCSYVFFCFQITVPQTQRTCLRLPRGPSQLALLPCWAASAGALKNLSINTVSIDILLKVYTGRCVRACITPPCWWRVLRPGSCPMPSSEQQDQKRSVCVCVHVHVRLYACVIVYVQLNTQTSQLCLLVFSDDCASDADRPPPPKRSKAT